MDDKNLRLLATVGRALDDSLRGKVNDETLDGMTADFMSDPVDGVTGYYQMALREGTLTPELRRGIDEWFSMVRVDDSPAWEVTGTERGALLSEWLNAGFVTRPKDWITCRKAAEEYGVTRQSVLQAIRNRRVVARKFRSIWYVEPESLKDFYLWQDTEYDDGRSLIRRRGRSK